MDGDVLFRPLGGCWDKGIGQDIFGSGVVFAGRLFVLLETWVSVLEKVPLYGLGQPTYSVPNLRKSFLAMKRPGS